jgi:hypothetical protein
VATAATATSETVAHAFALADVSIFVSIIALESALTTTVVLVPRQRFVAIPVNVIEVAADPLFNSVPRHALHNLIGFPGHEYIP